MQGPNLKPMSHLAQSTCADMPRELPTTIHPPLRGVRKTAAFTRARVRRRAPL
ncbi:hypothetical protein BSY239_2144 [Hydrogenophaga sp. RAC07]|uniref:hypothetical protein n=1 Tax=Hydrogenophaga sp. RAC07 TaxID=1842537 RepID=UPI000856161E|nr:hypothetical protein [Hydrogenophaga sp. RAC07]AOF84489.1 hypothetical protein BSY239_2144 [Hydrogenophaga sp. RAC07]